MADGIIVELVSTTKSNRFHPLYADHFFSVLLEEDSMWTLGWDENYRQVLWHVKIPSFEVLQKAITYRKPYYLKPIMVSFANRILFTEKGSNDIYGFNTQTQTFKTMFSSVQVPIDAMCCNDEHIYIFQKRRPDVIQILDSNFRSVGQILTGFEVHLDLAYYEVDLCTMRASTHGPPEYKTKHHHRCIISISNTYCLVRASFLSKTRSVSPCLPAIRAVNEKGVIWQVDSRRCPELDSRFNPRSVSTSEEGDVFIADNGANRVRVNSPT